MLEQSLASGKRRLSSSFGSVESLVLGAIVFLGCFLPINGESPARSIQDQLGLNQVPAIALSAVFAVLSLAAVAMLPRRRWPLFAVAVLAWVARSMWPPLVVATYVAATTYRRPAHLVGYTVVATAVAVLLEFLGVIVSVPGASWSDLITSFSGAALFVWLPLAIGRWVATRRQVIEALQERAEQQARKQAARAKEVRAEERARIAHDMHDVVAHRVSLMVLHAGALEVNAEDEKSAAAAALIRTTGREALAQLRDVLGVLRSPEQAAEEQLRPGATLADLDALLDQSRSAGIPVHRRDEGTVRTLPLVVQHTAYRVVQEALTNVHKHAGQVPTDVVVRYLSAVLEITVCNTAASRLADPLPGSGLGLVGLRERVELLGGELTAGPRLDGGFAVSARLPLAAFGEEQA